jgi:hypothetical protein
VNQGINKPGGVAWVTAVHTDDGSFDVKYVLGQSRDLRVPRNFVSKSPDLLDQRSARKRKHNFMSHENDTSQKLFILTSQLYDDSLKILTEFCDMFNAEIVNIYSAKVTHLVVSANETMIVQQRTMKYLKSLTGKIN